MRFAVESACEAGLQSWLQR